tara:strand:+ start:42 stop:551 length:510 start_codon:yes stop_codon:yes gene_type:complete
MNYAAAVGGVFAGGGVLTLLLYEQIRRGKSKFSQPQLWGYLYGHLWSWVAGTLITVGAVLGLFGWIVFGGGEPDGSTEESLVLSGTVIFIAGAVLWPVGILCTSMKLATAGVLAAAVGSVLLCAYTFTLDSPPAARAAAVWVVLHHCVVDGLWTVRATPQPAPLESQFL